METTFMTIHNLTPNANILYASDSIVDILGYQPQEVVGRSCFEYFHPEELPFAKSEFHRGVRLDKAAVLQYARIIAKNGQWIYCECVFTVVYNVLVACTSIYKEDEKSDKRKVDAPVIRRMFASSPRDPRYHMLQQLSVKFQAPSEPSHREPRAALILNRFTRTLTVMYTTDAVMNILGLNPNVLNGKSFYECIQENCLPDAIRCLESAKANDSIAYLRFWYRDPRPPQEIEQHEREASNSSDSDEDGGVQLNDRMDVDAVGQNTTTATSTNSGSASGSGSTTSSDMVFDHLGPAQTRSTSSSVSAARTNGSRGDGVPAPVPVVAPFELEAVVSCTSDGLVVILRRARPAVPQFQPIASQQAANGIFAAPWGANPILPRYPGSERGFGAVPPREAVDGPVMDSLISSIREVAVFAWGVTGINGDLAKYGHGKHGGESVPPHGFPIWDPQTPSDVQAPENQAWEKWHALHQPHVTADSDRVASQHSRQQDLVRQQMGHGKGFMGTDIAGSSARHHLGAYIGEDGRGPDVFEAPVSDQMLEDQKSKSPSSSRSHGYGPSSGSSGDRYLWY